MLYYNMSDFDEMAKFAKEVKDYFPKDPELALEHFQRSYSRLIALLIVSMTWNYLEAEKMVTEGFRPLNDPFEGARAWKPQDYLKYQHWLRN